MFRALLCPWLENDEDTDRHAHNIFSTIEPVSILSTEKPGWACERGNNFDRRHHINQPSYEKEVWALEGSPLEDRSWSSVFSGPWYSPRHCQLMTHKEAVDNLTWAARLRPTNTVLYYRLACFELRPGFHLVFGSAAGRCLPFLHDKLMT
jgi:hypothetical protein